jgi:hypothetical protein
MKVTYASDNYIKDTQAMVRVPSTLLAPPVNTINNRPSRVKGEYPYPVSVNPAHSNASLGIEDIIRTTMGQPVANVDRTTHHKPWYKKVGEFFTLKGNGRHIR